MIAEFATSILLSSSKFVIVVLPISNSFLFLSPSIQSKEIVLNLIFECLQEKMGVFVISGFYLLLSIEVGRTSDLLSSHDLQQRLNGSDRTCVSYT